MRLLVLLFTFLFVQGALAALRGASKEAEPAPPKFSQALEHMTNPAIENLVGLAEQVTASPELGDCPHFTYRRKMLLPTNINYDAALNEFMSMVTPGERTFAFALLSAKPSSANSILKMAQSEATGETLAELTQLNAQTNAVLDSSANAVLMVGTALYAGAGLADADMSVRAIVDSDASEFLIFGAGKCQ